MDRPTASAITTSSILDTLGAEVLGVISPVSICMLLVVLLISILSSPTSNPSTPPALTAATLVYLETPSDSPSQKIFGALLDAAVFVALVAAVTFLLVLLYYYRFTGFLKNYMRFSAFFVLFSMGGGIVVTVLHHFFLPVDAPTTLLLLFNASAVGVLAVFSSAVPILVRQAYMVALAVIVAAWLSRLPEWTTWVMLVALAVYDLVAVLAPRGPLRILVELASSRDDDLPALVYESRPTVAPATGSSSYASSAAPASTAALGSVELQQIANFGPSRDNRHAHIGQEEDLPLAVVEMRGHGEDRSVFVGGSGSRGILGVGEKPSSSDPIAEVGNPEADMQLVRAQPSNVTQQEVITGTVGSQHAVIDIESVEEETAPLMSLESANDCARNDEHGRDSPPSQDFEMFEATRGIKLGLGDFVFYSVLVGRAAMYDLMTVYACYLAIIAGLGCTLILLSICRHVLPALPISIMLGVGFYFLTRLLMEPFVVGASTNLVMF